jgi:hypothetical protein
MDHNVYIPSTSLQLPCVVLVSQRKQFAASQYV